MAGGVDSLNVASAVAVATWATRSGGTAAAALGLTVRTLHHWDEIALASPSRRSPAGYRLYTGQDLERLRSARGHGIDPDSATWQ